MTGDGRDFLGYGALPPRVEWPGGARVAVSFVLNIEEGAEHALSAGDERNESVYEVGDEVQGQRDLCIESHFEYGSRAGYWRIMRVLAGHGATVTLNLCGRALVRSPWLGRHALAQGHEAMCHGWRWEHHHRMTEAALMAAALVAQTFSIVTLPVRTRIHSHRVVQNLGLGLALRCGPIRAVDVPVLHEDASEAEVVAALMAEARLALEQDGAEAVILGCAGIGHHAGPMQAELGVPVIDGVAAGLGMAEMLVRCSWPTSRRSTFAVPPHKRLTGPFTVLSALTASEAPCWPARPATTIPRSRSAATSTGQAAGGWRSTSSWASRNTLSARA